MDLIEILTDPAFMAAAGLCMLLVIALGAIAANTAGRQERTQAAFEQLLERDFSQADLDRICREAERAATIDHVMALQSDRRNPHPHHSRPALVWALAYSARRTALEDAERAAHRPVR